MVSKEAGLDLYISGLAFFVLVDSLMSHMLATTLRLFKEHAMIRAYIDYQNTYRLLKDREGFCLLSLRMGALVAELIESVGEDSAPTHRAFSGIHSIDVDPASRTRRLKQFCALQ